jgi:TM2 domain-containing membrane protein YozV
MFSKPGKTLMDYARNLFYALVIFFIGFGIIVMTANDIFTGILIILVGILGSFLACLLLAGIGQAVESLRIIAISTNTLAGDPIDDDKPVA